MKYKMKHNPAYQLESEQCDIDPFSQQLSTFSEYQVLKQNVANLTHYKPPLSRTKNSG